MQATAQHSRGATPRNHRVPSGGVRPATALAVALAAMAWALLALLPVSAATAVRARVVRVAPVKVTVYVQSPGTVIAARSAMIASRLTGYIDHINVDIGDRVKKGEVLLTIDSRDVEAKVRQAHANIAAAQATLADARSNYHRYRVLMRQGAVSHQTYQRAERDYKTAQAQLNAAEAGLKVALAERTYAQVRAPMAGVVTTRAVDAGDLATPGKPLLSVQASGAMQVMSHIPAQAYRALKVGSTVNIRASSGTTVRARAIHLGPAAAAGTETHPAKFALPANAGLNAGTFVQVLVPVGRRPALLVPASAITRRLGIPAVFVVDPQGRAQLRLVRVGNRRGSRVEITAGLQAGERVIASPNAQIDNGTPIEAEQGHSDGA